jgi:mannose-6-phosphate isomerase-like protein (cupin superfamily)
MGDGYTLKSWDDFEQMEGSGESMWRLARKSLGISSFGINIVDIGAGGQIPEHDETGRDQEEVFIIVEGDAVAVIDGIDNPAPRGTFVRVAPEVRRTIRNDGDAPVRLMVISAPETSGYEPMGWG